MTFDRPGRILPVPPDQERPKWSVMIPSYRCAAFLGRTLESVLAQDPGPDTMQIEVVDDCSDDSPESVVERCGAHRVEIFRQPHNVGVSANFTACVVRARGRYVHILHGDDLAEPGLYQRAAEVLDNHPEADALIVGCREIDENDRATGAFQPWPHPLGEITGFQAAVNSWNPVRAPAVIVRRAFYERWGGFHPDLRYCADWDMWKRLAAYGTVFYLPECLMSYRIHSGSDTARLAGSAAQLAEIVRSVRISRRYPERAQTRRWSRNALYVVATQSKAAARDAVRAADAPGALRFGRVYAESVLRLRTDRLFGWAGASLP